MHCTYEVLDVATCVLDDIVVMDHLMQIEAAAEMGPQAPAADLSENELRRGCELRMCRTTWQAIVFVMLLVSYMFHYSTICRSRPWLLTFFLSWTRSTQFGLIEQAARSTVSRPPGQLTKFEAILRRR
jgi:hypothetical protein